MAKPPELDRKIVAETKHMFDIENDDDTVIQFMREAGLELFDCIEVLFEIGRYSMGQAKRVVLNSPVWEDEREDVNAFHDDLERIIEKEQWRYL